MGKREWLKEWASEVHDLNGALRKYTPKPSTNGYPAKTCLLAIRMYVEWQ